MRSALLLTMRVVAALLLVGCWSNAQPAWTPPSSTEPPVTLQCPIRLSETGHVFVWETDLGVLATRVGTKQLAIYPLAEDQALVALRERDESRGPLGGDTLWRVRCDGKKLDAITIEGADFGHAALHPDRRRLFYSAGSVMMLDLQTRRSTKITTPTQRGCGKLRAETVDSVRGVTRDHVEFERGAACGFESEWSATGMRRHLERGIEEKATPITGLVTTDTGVWLAAGGCGDAAIYHSTDWRSWQRVTTPESRGRITLVSDRRTRSVVMATGLCSGTNGVPAMITRDAGKTWTPISKAVVEWVSGEDLATLRAGAASGQLMRWKDTALVGVSVQWRVAPTLPATTTIDGRTVRPTRFGLYLGDERVFPR
jgi:hypothetical protein